MDKIRSLRFFIATLDGGSFAAAAKGYGTDPSTVSKAIHRLESDLGIQLFQRSTRQQRLTEAGRRYASTARRVLEELTACEETLKSQNDTPSGTLKINVPVSYGRLYIRPLLKEFCRRYPNISIDIHYDDAYVDIIEQGIDVSIRSGSVQDSQLVVRQLSPIDFIICASRDYLDRHGIPPGPETFQDHSWIRFRYKQTGKLLPIQVQGAEGVSEYDPNRSFIVNDGESMAELCAEGLGITQIPHFIARDWLQLGRLLPLFPSQRQAGTGVYLLYARREYLPARVRVFVEYITEAIQAQGETPRSTWAERLQVFQPDSLS
ncbi:LysR family transcriptional regulator [Motiliproteus coralliicola]|uniref:LysR family transcriptional regulator n=1 Tax=Motiliproteus coralliicola TaxID=2283196 RepID=A0A369WS82_9GAMM|nr:LysR family transcriptional regulator [Motiliproteus coralliicola]RDE24960.1 LysR family transcriptional regulator [Motiliproteus coralliicola]